MKKEYAAPDLYFESFELSGSIAAGCGVNGIGIVKQMYSTMGWFVDGAPSGYTCTDTSSYSSFSQDYCYYAGNEKWILFAS